MEGGGLRWPRPAPHHLLFFPSAPYFSFIFTSPLARHCPPLPLLRTDCPVLLPQLSPSAPCTILQHYYHSNSSPPFSTPLSFRSNSVMASPARRPPAATFKPAGHRLTLWLITPLLKCMTTTCCTAVTHMAAHITPQRASWRGPSGIAGSVVSFLILLPSIPQSRLQPRLRDSKLIVCLSHSQWSSGRTGHRGAAHAAVGGGWQAIGAVLDQMRCWTPPWIG